MRPHLIGASETKRHRRLNSAPKSSRISQHYGINPRDSHTQGYYAFSIWYHVTDPRWMMVVHVSILVIVFLFMIGFCTRITSVLTWLGVISYTQRAPTTLFGMDTMMNLLLDLLDDRPERSGVLR